MYEQYDKSIADTVHDANIGFNIDIVYFFSYRKDSNNKVSHWLSPSRK